MVIQGRGALLGHNDNIFRGQPVLMMPEKFPEQAPDPVALHRFAQTFRHHQPQPGAPGWRWGQSNAKMPGMQPPPLGQGPEEFGPAQEAILLGEAGGPWCMAGRDGDGALAVLSGMAQKRPPALKRSGVCGLWPGGASRPGAPPGCSSGSKNRGCAPGANCWVEMYVSWLFILEIQIFPNFL